MKLLMKFILTLVALVIALPCLAFEVQLDLNCVNQAGRINHFIAGVDNPDKNIIYSPSGILVKGHRISFSKSGYTRTTLGGWPIDLTKEEPPPCNKRKRTATAEFERVFICGAGSNSRELPLSEHYLLGSFSGCLDFHPQGKEPCPSGGCSTTHVY